MRTAPLVPHTPARMQAGVRISLELEPGDPVSGSIRDAAGNDQRFSGWLELHSLLARMRERASRGSAHSGGQPAEDKA